MAATSNIPRDIQESIRDVLDKRVKVSLKRLVKMEVRGDKVDNRVLAFSPCRLFILTAKVPSKLENSFHFLDIQAIESKKVNQLSLTIDGKLFTFNSIDANTDEMDHMITHIGISLKQIFPSFPLERLVVKLEVQPVERLKTMQDMVKSIEKKEVGPCGGFTTMYQCMCDYHGLPFREEVAWDVDTIYLSHDSRELRLQDFDHLSGKDLVPIIGALEHNTWFKRVNGSNVKLTAEACTELIKVMKRNAVVEEVNLSNTGIKIEFVQKFSLAIISNSGTQLSSLDLSNNLLDDKAITHLMGAVKSLPCGLTSFDLSKTNITTRCLNKIGEMLGQAPGVLSALTTLKLNDNGLKGDDFPMLYNCLAQPNAISYLDLSFTDCALDMLCDPLLRGCLNLKTLKASRTVFTHKRSKDVQIPQSWKQLFASCWCLEEVDFSSCKLPVEALKEMLLGLSSNRNIKNLMLDLNSNELGMAGANVLASCVAAMTCISGLDISNNGFDIDLKALVPELSKNSYLKHLSLGRNFANIKPKHMPDVMSAIALLLQEETSGLESLSLAESKLKTDATYVINALGSNTSLQEIDISGNSIGDLGARMLAKALLINTKLRKVVWDKNNVSAQGFEDVAEALQKNMTMRKMPFPVNDAAAALRVYPERTEAALQKIESFLQRNHSPRRFASDQAYRLQQGFLLSSTQQMVDRLVVQVQDTVNALHALGTMDVYATDVEHAEKVVADANNSRQLLSGLQDVAIKCEASGNSIDVQLQTMADKLRQAIEEQLQKTTEEMLKCTTDHCPAIMSNPTFQETIKEGCQSKTVLPKDFTQGVLEGASTDIYNMAGKMNLTVAALISDSVVDEVIDSLSSTHKTLTNHLNLRRSGHYKETTEEEKTEDIEGAAKSKVSGEGSPKFTNKRKSLLNRKMRPQSTIDRSRRASNIIEEGEQEEEAIYQNLPITGIFPGEDGLGGIEEKPGLNKLEERSTESTPLGSTEQLADFGELPSTSSRPLEHITKARPRREKAHRPTRPVIAAGSTEMEDGENNGLNPLYQSQTSQAGSSGTQDVRSAGKDSKEGSSAHHAKPEPPAKVKQEESGKSEGKKWKPGFMKKNKEEKESKDAKKSNSFSSSFSNIFKKDKKRSSSSSGPETTENKVEVDTTIHEAPVLEHDETKHADTSEVLKETDKPAEDVFDLGKSNKSVEQDKTEERAPGLTRPVKDRLPLDRMAMLPPTKKLETRAPTLATEEDTTLGSEDKTESKEPPASPEAPPPDDAEKEEAPKRPPGLPKMAGGLGALGGKNLLQEMKLKQEKRFSKLPASGEEEKEAAKENKAGSAQDTEVKKLSPASKPPELTKPTLASDEQSKKDLNDNTAEGSPSRPALKPTPPSKGPAPIPRALVPPKRPVSTVEDSGTLQEPPKCMTTSTPELLLGDSSSNPAAAARTKPPPPIKPRPPVAPRTKKRESGTEDSTAPEITSPSAAAPSQPVQSPKPPTSPSVAPPSFAKTTPLSAVTEKVKTGQANEATEAEPEMRAKPVDEGIVYDSATLRLSVKDKIKRLSQAKGVTVSDTPSPSSQALKQKAMSLPKDSKLPDTLPDDDAPPADVKGDSPAADDKIATVQEEEGENCVQTSSIADSPAPKPPDDEIMV